LGFKFRSLPDSVSTASGIAHGLQEHDPDVVLSVGSLLWEYRPDKINELSEFLCCDKLRLVLSSKAHASICDQEERWYGTKFSDKPLDTSSRERWQVAGSFEDLALPAPNPFIPENFDLKPAAGAQPLFPERLVSTAVDIAYPQNKSVITSYFRKDEVFGLPKAACAFVLYCPFCLDSVEHRMLAELWCMAVQEELNEFSYEASCAGVSYSLQATSSGMIISFGGYDDKLPRLLTEVAGKMAGLAEVPEQTYAITRAILERNLTNAAVRSPPYSQGFMFEQCMLRRPAHRLEDRLEALKGIGREQLAGINRKLLDHCHIECLLQGNLTADESQGLIRSFLEPLGVSRPLDVLPESGSLPLPSGWTLLEREGTNPDERNGAAIVTLQVGEYGLDDKCLVDLASQVLGQRFFDELRTKQQLGYIVSASSFGEPQGFVGLRMVVQSERPPREVLSRVRAWAEESWGFADQMTEDEFAEYRAALVSQLRERPKSLNEEFGLNWSEVASRNLDFGSQDAEANRLEALTLGDLRRFVAERLRAAPALCTLVRPPGVAEDTEPAPPNFDRRWSPEEVEAYRKSGPWRLRDAAIRRDSAEGLARSRL